MMMAWWAAACILLLNMVVGLLVTTRRRPADALLALQLFGTVGVALALILGHVLKLERGVDIALVLSLLAAVLGVAAERLGWFGAQAETDLGK